jgi:KDO2-lipid IV(A) lauroyltransferase
MGARSPEGEARPGVLDRMAGAIVLGLARGLGALAPAWGDGVGAALGTVAYLVDRAHRHRAVENLLRAGIAEDRASARRITRRVFQNLGRSFADLCRLPRLTDAEIAERIRVEGYEHVREARARGRGIIVVTAHLGAWELLPVMSAIRGAPIHSVVRPMDNVTIDRALTAIRSRGGNGIIRKQDLLRRGLGLKVLKAGGMLGIVMDQNITWREGVFVEFFGRTANTAFAPALLALRTGAAVIPAAIFREGPGRHRIVVEKPIEIVRSGDLRRDLQENTARFTQAIEAFIRRSPAEWFWVHRRWKTQPLGPDSPSSPPTEAAHDPVAHAEGRAGGDGP